MKREGKRGDGRERKIAKSLRLGEALKEGKVGKEKDKGVEKGTMAEQRRESKKRKKKRHNNEPHSTNRGVQEEGVQGLERSHPGNAYKQGWCKSGTKKRKTKWGDRLYLEESDEGRP